MKPRRLADGGGMAAIYIPEGRPDGVKEEPDSLGEENSWQTGFNNNEGDRAFGRWRRATATEEKALWRRWREFSDDNFRGFFCALTGSSRVCGILVAAILNGGGGKQHLRRKEPQKKIQPEKYRHEQNISEKARQYEKATNMDSGGGGVACCLSDRRRRRHG